MTFTPRTTRRLTSLAAAAALASLGLAACGSDPTPTSSAAEPSSSGSGGGLNCPPGKLTGEGSTAQGNAIAEAIAGYSEQCGDAATIEYNATGSGAGIKQFYGGLVDWAGSDSALKSVSADGVVETERAKQRCGGNEAWNLPMVIGPIAFAYHLDGVEKLVLTPHVLADIFTGKISTWNHPAIAKLNRGVSLPEDKIAVFFRSDESGTTENVAKFLQGAAPDRWTKEPSKSWTGVGEGKNKSSGVAEGVTSTNGSISYMEWSYAKDNNLTTAEIDNGAGPVALSGAAVGKAVGEATVKGTGNDLRLGLKYADTAAGAYPALLVTYEIVCSKGLAAEQTAVLKDFLSYFAQERTQSSLEDLGYAPLPSRLRTKVASAVAAIQ